MEKIARGGFISPQRCLCTRFAHIFSSLSLNQSSLLCVSPPAFLSSFLYSFNLPYFLPSLYPFFTASCPGWSLLSTPILTPQPCQSGRPREDEAALSRWAGSEGRRDRKSYRGRERCGGGAQHRGGDRAYPWGGWKDA